MMTVREMPLAMTTPPNTNASTDKGQILPGGSLRSNESKLETDLKTNLKGNLTTNFKAHQKIVLGFLSLGIIYHLLAVSILPNSNSLEGRVLSRWVIPYANQFGLNTPWQFFSPGPSPTFFLEYEVQMGDDEDEGGREPLIWPPHKQGRGYSDSYNRNLYSMRYFALNDVRLEHDFVPWLCRQYPGARRLMIRAVLEPVMTIERAGMNDGVSDVANYETIDKMNDNMNHKMNDASPLAGVSSSTQDSDSKEGFGGLAERMNLERRHFVCPESALETLPNTSSGTSSELSREKIPSVHSAERMSENSDEQSQYEAR